MHEFSDMAEVESTLERLASREDGPYVVRLAREPASAKAVICTFCGDVELFSRRSRRKVRRAIFVARRSAGKRSGG